MDQYIPPLVAVTSGVVVVFLCFFMRVPFFIVGLLSIFLVIYALQDHLYRFAVDYHNFSAPALIKQNASILIISLVILLSLGFLLLKFGSKAITTNQPLPNHGTPGMLSGFFGKTVAPPYYDNRRTTTERSLGYGTKV